VGVGAKGRETYTNAVDEEDGELGCGAVRAVPVWEVWVGRRSG